MKKDILYTKKTKIITFLLITIFVFQGQFLLAQKTQTNTSTFIEYNGSVVDISTKKALIFADLNVKGTNISTITNSEGEFLLKIPKDITNKIVVVSYLGYESLDFLLYQIMKKIKLKLLWSLQLHN